MIGAIIGDVIGSSYEFNNVKKKDFAFFTNKTRPTDDTIMTVAVMNTIIDCYPLEYRSLYLYKDKLIKNMVKWYHLFPNAGYGGMFHKWLANPDNHPPYLSYGNGAGMRISPVGWIANSEEEVRLLSKATTEITHNHPEGIKGAEAIAMCIYFARKGKTKQFIKHYVEKHYYPNLALLDYGDLLKNYKFNSTCQKSVPEAIYCFLISKDFEDCLRTTISIGGDCDTTAAMSCAIAEAYYKSINYVLVDNVRLRLSKEINNTIDAFNLLIK